MNQFVTFLALTCLLVTGRSAAALADDVPPPDTKCELVLFDFGDANDKQVRDAAIARFYTHYPNIKVTDHFIPVSSWADYIEKLMAEVAYGNAPDLIHVATEGAQLAISKNLVIPLDSYVKSDAAAKDLLTDVDPALLKGFTVEGKLYLVPVAWNSMLIYYNTKVFKEAGIARQPDNWTWDDFFSVAKRLTSGEGPDKKFGFGIPYFNFGLAPFWYSNATAVLKDDLTESNLLDPNFLESVKFIRRLVHENGVSPDPANTNPNLVFQLFATGRIAMTGGGHWPIQFFNANRFNDYDIVPWPKNKAARTVFGADGWGISTKAKERAIAWEMVKELASTTSEQEAAELGVAIPARRTVAESPEFLAQPQHAALFYQTLSYAAPVQAPANYSVIEQILFRHLGQVLTEEVKPEDALKAADEELSAALKQPAAMSH